MHFRFQKAPIALSQNSELARKLCKLVKVCLPISFNFFFELCFWALFISRPKNACTCQLLLVPSTRDVRSVTLAAFLLPAGKARPILSNLSRRFFPPSLDLALKEKLVIFSSATFLSIKSVCSSTKILSKGWPTCPRLSYFLISERHWMSLMVKGNFFEEVRRKFNPLCCTVEADWIQICPRLLCSALLLKVSKKDPTVRYKPQEKSIISQRTCN